MKKMNFIIFFILILSFPLVNTKSLDLDVEIKKDTEFLDVLRDKSFQFQDFPSKYLIIVLFWEEVEIVIRNCEIMYPCLNKSEIDLVTLYVDYDYDTWNLNGFLEFRALDFEINWYYGFVNNSYSVDLFDIYSSNQGSPGVFVYNVSTWTLLYYNNAIKIDNLLDAFIQLNLNLTSFPLSWWDYEHGYQQININTNNLSNIPKNAPGFEIFIVLITICLIIWKRKAN